MVIIVSCKVCTVQAVPTLYPQFTPPPIRNETDSNYLADTEHKNLFYVLPPRNAIASVYSFSQVSANMGFCKELAELQGYSRETLALLGELQRRILRIEKSDHEKEAQLLLARAEFQQTILDFRLEDMVEIESELQQNEARLAQLYAESRQCKEFCNKYLNEISQLQGERVAIIRKKEQARINHGEKMNIYDSHRLKLLNIERERAEILKHLTEIRAVLMQSYRDYIAMYEVHAKREGAKAIMKYKSNWSENIQKLNFANSQIQFVQMPVKNVSIKADAYAQSNLLPGAAIMSFEISGQKAKDSVSLNSFPETFSSQVTLNLMGACPFFFPELFGLSANDPSLNPESLKFALMVGYEYPSNFKYSVEVKYNLYRLYEIVKESGTKGGLFETKTWSDEKEAETFRDAFTVKWNQQDPSLNVDEDQKRKIETDLRRQILTRISKTLLFNGEAKPLVGSLPTTPKSGSIVLADSLSKNCPFSLNCKAFSMGLDFIAGVFGSSSNSQKLRQELDVESTETISNNQVVMQPGLTSFN